MIDNKYQRGFTSERLTAIREPKVKEDDRGFYLMSLSENTKVYFDDFYSFLETTHQRARADEKAIEKRLASIDASSFETIAYYRARLVIIGVLKRTINRFYTDGVNLGVVMTPWCFGTVVLEKIEVYRDRLSRGDVYDPSVPEYPYYVVRYMNEIYNATLLELFDFPGTAFQMRWQYSELLKKYSQMLGNITTSLQSVLMTIKNNRT